MEAQIPHYTKIRELFRHRKLDWLFQQSEAAPDQDAFRQLIRVQSRIYDLDQYLETHWVLSPHRLKAFWQEIEDSLDYWPIPAREKADLLLDIRQYQAQELLVRTGGQASTIPLEEFYRYKTCDVRLIRRLIIRLDPPLETRLPASLWCHYDMLTEVDDDLSDQAEDKGTHNVNRYLAALECGEPHQVRAEYSRFADQLLAAGVAESSRMDFPWKDRYLKWIREAREVLRQKGLDGIPS